ncbi:MAG: DMT family transporter [Paracoccaceae bacterium]|nr:DMT family transporter [Paracoccaceae bacterium]
MATAMEHTGNNLRGALYALLAFAIFATHDVVVKFLGNHYSAVQIIFFSVLLGFPLVTVMLMNDRTDGNLRPRHPWWTALRTVSAVITGVSAFYAFSVLPLAQTYAIFFAAPLLITLLAIPILGEKVGVRRGLAIVVGLIGVLIVLRPGGAELSLGHAAALTAAVFSSLASVIVRKIGQDERSVVLLLYPMMANFVVLGCALPFVYKPMPVAHLGMVGIIAAFGFVAMLLVIAAYRSAEAVIVAPMQYSQMIWAAIFGALIFDESPDTFTLIGAGVIIASGVYIVLREDHGSVSENRPVLSSKSRPETGTMPRISLMLKRRERRDRDTGPNA